jgi:hypothetical protein
MRRDIQDQFKKKGGRSVGATETVGGGKLKNVGGSSPRAYGGDKPVRPQIDEKAKKLDR